MGIGIDTMEQWLNTYTCSKLEDCGQFFYPCRKEWWDKLVTLEKNFPLICNYYLVITNSFPPSIWLLFLLLFVFDLESSLSPTPGILDTTDLSLCAWIGLTLLLIELFGDPKEKLALSIFFVRFTICYLSNSNCLFIF